MKVCTPAPWKIEQLYISYLAGKKKKLPKTYSKYVQSWHIDTLLYGFCPYLIPLKEINAEC